MRYRRQERRAMRRRSERPASSYRQNSLRSTCWPPRSCDKTQRMRRFGFAAESPRNRRATRTEWSECNGRIHGLPRGECIATCRRHERTDEARRGPGSPADRRTHLVGRCSPTSRWPTGVESATWCRVKAESEETFGTSCSIENTVDTISILREDPGQQETHMLRRCGTSV